MVILVVVEVRLLEILVVDRNASGNISRRRSKTARVVILVVVEVRLLKY